MAREIGLQLDNHGHAHYESGVEVEAVEQPDGTVRQVAKRTKTGKPRSIRGRLMSRHELEMIAAHLDVIRDYQDERAAEYAAWHDAGRNILYGVEHERIWGRRVATIRDGTMQEKNTAATIPALPEQADHPKKQVQSQADGQDENTDQPPLVWKDDYIAAFLPPSMTREYYTPPPAPDQRPGFYRRHELGIKAAAVAGTLALAATMLGLTSANDEHAPPASHVHIETQPGPGAIQEPMPGYGEGRVGQRHVPSQGQKSKEQPRHHAASVVVPTSITLNGHEGDSLWSASARSITLNSEGLYKALGHQRADELLVRVTNQEMRDNGIPNERAAEHLPVNFSARISKQVKRIVRHFVHRFIKARARA
ncbi:MAG TPA: hypothetical protein VFH39_04000 [Candidatus Saccharimonadales bacterium]|nr:hypothetical protein [Candidatus Saccharimonadales bacterium]